MLELRKAARFLFISANVMDSASAKPIFTPFFVLTAGNKSFGVTGVTSPFKYGAAGIKFQNPVESLQKIIPTLQKKADYIVVLAAVNNEDELSLINANLPIDFMLIAGMYRYSQSLDLKGKGVIARAGTLGKYVGIITAEINAPEKSLEDISNINTQIQYATYRLQAFEQSAGGKPLEEYYSDKLSLLKIIHDLQALQKDLENRKKNIANSLNFNLVPLDEKIADDPVVRRKLEACYKNLRKINISEH